MALTIQDLQPKGFKVEIKGLILDCKAPRLSHTLVLSKVGEMFNNLDKLEREDIVKAEKDFDWVVAELIPELKGIELGIQDVLEIVTQIMEHVAPEENKELEEKGVKFDSDPKVEKIG